MTSVTGGCLRKVDLSSLVTLLGDAMKPDLPDVESAVLPPGVGSVATSVDLVYDFGVEPAELGRIATVHSLSDLYAALATPFLATLSLGLSLGSLASAGPAVVTAVRDALRAEDVTFGGGHTVHAERTFLSVSVVGLDPVVPYLKPFDGSPFELFLTKPLGTGIQMTGRVMGVGSPAGGEGWEAALSHMLQSNREASIALKNQLRLSPSGIGFVTDVTGFGLLTALESRVPSGWTASINVDSIPVFQESERLVRDFGVVTSLGDANYLRARTNRNLAIGSVPLAKLLVLCDPQTSGGLLTAVSPEVASALSHGPGDWHHIGRVAASRDASAQRIELIRMHE